MQSAALLYLRHLSLWKQIPRTNVYEMEITKQISTDQAFPRPLRRIARGNFSITEVAEAADA